MFRGLDSPLSSLEFSFICNKRPVDPGKVLLLLALFVMAPLGGFFPSLRQHLFVSVLCQWQHGPIGNVRAPNMRIELEDSTETVSLYGSE